MNALSDAEQHLVRYGITEPRQIDLEAIAWTMGAKVHFRHLESCEAKLTGVQNKANIHPFGVKSASVGTTKISGVKQPFVPLPDLSLPRRRAPDTRIET